MGGRLIKIPKKMRKGRENSLRICIDLHGERKKKRIQGVGTNEETRGQKLGSRLGDIVAKELQKRRKTVRGKGKI